MNVNGSNFPDCAEVQMRGVGGYQHLGAARAVVEGLIWPFSLASGHTRAVWNLVENHCSSSVDCMTTTTYGFQVESSQ